MEPIQIEFNNTENPNSGFDLLQLERLLHRKDLDHSPLALHRVGFYMIILITEGSIKHTIDFTDYHLKKGSLITIRKNQIHKFHYSKSAKGIIILFTDEFISSYLENLEAIKALQLFNEWLSSPIVPLTPEQLISIKALSERMNAEYRRTNDRFSSGIIRSQLHILITKIYRIKSGNNPNIYRRKYLKEFITLQNHIEEKFAQTRSVQDYARYCGFSTKTLNKITYNIVNKSTKAFIDEICIKNIKRLILNTNSSIKEIAFSTGFDETTNFYKYFKRHVNCSPEQFRLNNQ